MIKLSTSALNQWTNPTSQTDKKQSVSISEKQPQNVCSDVKDASTVLRHVLTDDRMKWWISMWRLWVFDKQSVFVASSRSLIRCFCHIWKVWKRALPTGSCGCFWLFVLVEQILIRTKHGFRCVLSIQSIVGECVCFAVCPKRCKLHKNCSCSEQCHTETPGSSICPCKVPCLISSFSTPPPPSQPPRWTCVTTWGS